MTLNLAIVDDDSESRKLIAEKCRDILHMKDIEADFDFYPDATSFHEALKGHVFDLILLDIEMPGMTGIDLAKALNQEERKNKIVFVSNREDLVFESLEARPYGFVRKSHFSDDMNKVLTFYLQDIRKKDERLIVIESEGRQINLPVSNIVSIESMKRYQQIYVKGEKDPIMVSTTFSRFEDTLLDKGFITCYRGVMVNFMYIRVINEDYIELKDKRRLPMSRRYASQTKEKYMTLMKKEMALFY